MNVKTNLVPDEDPSPIKPSRIKKNAKRVIQDEHESNSIDDNDSQDVTPPSSQEAPGI